MAQSLYDKYGGFPTISAIVQNFYSKIGESSTLEKFFVNVDMDKLMDHQTKFICMVLGGPNNYNGKSLETAHAKLGIAKRDFDEVAGYLVEALQEAGMAADDIKAVVTLVSGTAPQIITA